MDQFSYRKKENKDTDTDTFFFVKDIEKYRLYWKNKADERIDLYNEYYNARIVENENKVVSENKSFFDKNITLVIYINNPALSDIEKAWYATLEIMHLLHIITINSRDDNSCFLFVNKPKTFFIQDTEKCANFLSIFFVSFLSKEEDMYNDVTSSMCNHWKEEIKWLITFDTVRNINLNLSEYYYINSHHIDKEIIPFPNSFQRNVCFHAIIPDKLEKHITTFIPKKYFIRYKIGDPEEIKDLDERTTKRLTWDKSIDIDSSVEKITLENNQSSQKMITHSTMDFRKSFSLIKYKKITTSIAPVIETPKIDEPCKFLVSKNLTLYNLLWAKVAGQRQEAYKKTIAHDDVSMTTDIYQKKETDIEKAWYYTLEILASRRSINLLRNQDGIIISFTVVNEEETRLYFKIFFVMHGSISYMPKYYAHHWLYKIKWLIDYSNAKTSQSDKFRINYDTGSVSKVKYIIPFLDIISQGQKFNRMNISENFWKDTILLVPKNNTVAYCNVEPSFDEKSEEFIFEIPNGQRKNTISPWKPTS